MSITAENRIEAAEWAIKTLRVLGRTDLEDVLRIEWKQSFTARLGDALYVRSGSVSNDALTALRGSTVGSRRWLNTASKVNSELAKNVKSGPSARVRFSIPLWSRATKTERYETVVHEICHIVTSHEAAIANKGVPNGHGLEWKATMRRAGCKPERCHSIDRTGIKKSRKTIQATCGCGSNDVTPYVAGRIAAGDRYRCRKCRERIMVDAKVAPVAKRGSRRRALRFTLKKINF